MENNKKQRLMIALILVAVMVISVGGTFAFFLTQAGRNEEQKLTIKTGNLALTFEDNDSGFNGSLMVGESAEKLFIIRNTGTQPVTTNMIWDGLVNTYIEESLSYTLEYKTSIDGTYQTLETAHTNVPHSDKADDYNLAKNITIPAGSSYYYKLTIIFNNLPDINQEADRTAILSTKFNLGDAVTELSPSQKTLAQLKITPNPGTPTFANAATTDEGVYSMADDYGTSYYYRGAVTNNYVKFGGFYWRIIRINGDGSIRMIYDGTQAWPNGNGASSFTTSGTDRFTYTGKVWNANYNDAKYVGWMFGGNDGTASTQKDGTTSTSATYNQTDSDIKEQWVDPWYKTNIVDKGLSKYVSDEIFCNDRSTAPSGSTWWTSENATNKGFGTNPTLYGAGHRVFDSGFSAKNPEPTFVCPEKNDAFTVSDTTKGNGALTYPVGLITTDEIVAAGSGKYNTTNRYYYLYKSSGYWYWSLSPVRMDTGGYANVFVVGTSGGLGSNGVSGSGAVAPVINLSADYAATLTGSGETTSPYQLPGVQ